jgi:hypothetical protein
LKDHTSDDGSRRIAAAALASRPRFRAISSIRSARAICSRGSGLPAMIGPVA